MMQTLSFAYADANLKTSVRQIEPQYLVCAWPFWYILAWDIERQAVRTFRLDRIKSPEPMASRFRLKAAEPFWQACQHVGICL